MELRPYQQAAVDAVYAHLRDHDDNPCVVIPTAGGKTPVMATICKDAVSRWNGRVLILAHVKELLQQAADKLQAICPDVQVGVYSAGLGSRDTLSPVILAGIQSAYRRVHEFGHFDLAVVDECFPSGTLIDKPTGAVPVETIRPGDFVFCATGIGEVLATSTRAADHLVELEYSDGSTLTCTPNHRIFTEHGWIEAALLEPGSLAFSREDLCLLWTGIPAVAPPDSGRQDRCYEGEALAAADVLLEVLLKEAQQSHGRSSEPPEGFADDEGEEGSTCSARRKRSPHAPSTVGAVASVGRGLDTRICGADSNAPRSRMANSLQVGLGLPKTDACDRDRREQSQTSYSAGARSQEGSLPCGKRLVRITHHECASPRSVFNLHVKEHPSFFANGVLVHNCHMIPPDGEGMYRTLLTALKETNPLLRVIGLTATPFRMSTGPICAPENILNTVCYEVGVRELIDQGYLCRLVTKAGRLKADTDKLRVRCGEYVSSDVERLMDDDELVQAACKEIVEFTQQRRSCLIFASGINHGDHVAQTLKSLGQNVATIYGDTFDFMRERTLADFKAGKLKYLVNVNVLTTGFDAPNIDCVALLRPTLSPGLYYQMVGRGFRLHPNKDNCLVLDFGGNALRHGPVDALRIQPKPFSEGDGEAPAKECPQCQGVIAAGHTMCPYCGYEFERQQAKHDAEASDEGVLSDQVTERAYDVQKVRYYVHYKRDAPADAPRTMRVEYQVGWQQFRNEWICLEHSGYARLKAEKWWAKRSNAPVPLSVEEAVEMAEGGALCQTKAIVTRRKAGERYEQIAKYELGEIPLAPDEQPVSECPECGCPDRELGPGTGPHAARENCAGCGRWLRWVPKRELAGASIPAPTPEPELEYVPAEDTIPF